MIITESMLNVIMRCPASPSHAGGVHAPRSDHVVPIDDETRFAFCLYCHAVIITNINVPRPRDWPHLAAAVNYVWFTSPEEIEPYVIVEEDDIEDLL